MNTFIIKQYGSTIFDRVCHSPPSEEDITLILTSLKKYEFKVLECNIDIIQGNNHRKVTKGFFRAEMFIDYLENLCKEGIKYGVVMCLHY